MCFIAKAMGLAQVCASTSAKQLGSGTVATANPASTSAKQLGSGTLASANPPSTSAKHLGSGTLAPASPPPVYSFLGLGGV